jgi:hypothetical protein
VTSTTPDGTYGLGAAINVTVTFSEPVTLAGGTLTIPLDSGGSVTIAPFGPATSASGTYTVGAGQSSPRLNALTPLVLASGATLRDAAHNDAVLTIPAGQSLADHKDLVIDAVVPSVTGVTSATPNGTYGIGAAINVMVTFSKAVTLAGGALTVFLNSGAAVTITPFTAATSATGTYVVGPGQNSPALDSQSPLVLAPVLPCATPAATTQP